MTMNRLLFLLLLMGAPLARAADYYVDCNYGSNGNPGTSTQQAWRTLLEVGISSFLPGDTVNLRRDCTWNETLTPPSSGTSGALIKIDSYGSGQAPRLTGYMPVAARWWTQVNGTNVWSATLYSSTSGLATVVQCGIRGFYCLTQPPSQLEYVRFGTMWGMAQDGEAELSQDHDFWYDSTNYVLYVYSTGGNPASYYSEVAPVVLSGESLLNLNGVSWLEVQHLQIDWFDSYGVQVQGAGDHLWLANMAANSQVENSTVPLGFYVHPTGTPLDIHLYDTDANMNYVGYHFDGCSGGGCNFELKNCRAYGNRTYGIVDNVQGAVNYDYCHLYGNYLATAIAVDVSGTPGPAAGAHNVAAQTAPWIRRWQRRPAYTTVTYDDPGLVQYSDTYVNGLLPIMSEKEIPLSIAVVTGGTYSQSIVGEVQGWVQAGWDINVHSVSHQYWNPPSTTPCNDDAGPIPCDAFLLSYVGTGSYTISITHSGGGGNLTLTTSPYDPACYHSWDLTPVPPGGTAAPGQIDTLADVISTLEGQPNCYAVDATAYDNEFAKGRAHAISLADTFSSAGVPGPMTLPAILPAASDCTSSSATPGCILFDQINVETDEMTWAASWFTQNLSGLPGLNLSDMVYVMPGTYGDALTESIANGLGFKGVRGTGSLTSTWVLGGADATLAKGYDAFNILSQGVVPNYQGLTYQHMRNQVSQDLFKNALWGRPIGYFWHVNELRPDEVENFMDALVQGGATLESNTEMVNLLLSCQANDLVPPGYVGGSFHVCPSSGGEADFRPTVNSPVIDVGINLGTEYQYDLLGINQNLFGTGWEIGAYAYVQGDFSAIH